MSVEHVQTTFELKDGRKLTCNYLLDRWPGNYFEPPETNEGEPEYELDGEVFELEELPKGLAYIAQDMYDNPNSYQTEYRPHYDYLD
jgi:hypothetical protein